MNNLTQKYKIIKVLSIKISFRDTKRGTSVMPVPLFLTKFLFQMMHFTVFMRDIFQRVQQPHKIFFHLTANKLL